MNITIELGKYAKRELNPIKHPTRGKSEIELTNITWNVELLVKLLKHEINEPSLFRVGDNFESAFKNIYELNKSELASSLELLATNFESFLKKIAFFKYKNSFSKYWDGDDLYKGINKSTLGELLTSTVYPKNSSDTSIAPISFPSPLIDFKSTKQAIYNRIREIRNHVHDAREYTNLELISSVNLVLGGYLLAIEDNKAFLSTMLIQEYVALSKKINNEEYSRLENFYIELSGIENIDFEINAKVTDFGALLSEIDNLDRIDENEDEEQGSSEIENVVTIAEKAGSFFLLGKPGSGKTTSLKKIFLTIARRFLAQDDFKRYPILLDANSYNLENTFSKLIQKEVDSFDLDSLREKYELVVLIDGINEINDAFRTNAINEVKYLLKYYDDISFIITSRKFQFKHFFNLPVYELAEPTESQIKSYALKFLGTESVIQLWDELSQNRVLYSFLFNPLYLKMIIKIFKLKGGKLPKNKGLLFSFFCDIILEREGKVYRTNKETKKNILSHIAFSMRNKGVYRRMNKHLVIDEIRIKTNSLHLNSDINELLDELIDNNFLTDFGDEIEFIHESYEEFFAALEMQVKFIRTRVVPVEYYDERWFEVLLIASDLFNNDVDRNLFFENLFIGEKKSSNKLITDFDSSDINEHFNIACKVAFNLKHEYPSLYEKATVYVSNYFSIWLHCKLNGKPFINFNSLIEATAMLSSFRLFQKLFNSNAYLAQWLYDEACEVNYTRDLDVKELFDEKFKERFDIFCMNLGDFGAFLYFLQKTGNNDKFWFAPSIKYRLNYFKNNAITTQEYSQLVNAFFLTGHVKILNYIAATDLDFYITHYPKKNKKFYSFISQKIQSNAKARIYLINALRSEEIEIQTIEMILDSLLQNIDVFEQALQVLDSFESEIKRLLLESIKIRARLYSFHLKFLEKYSFFDSVKGNINRKTPSEPNSKVMGMDKYIKEIEQIEVKTGLNLFCHPDLQVKQYEQSDKSDNISLSDIERKLMKKFRLEFLIDKIENNPNLCLVTNVIMHTNIVIYHCMFLQSRRIFEIKEPLVSTNQIIEKGSFCYVQSSIRLRQVENELIFKTYSLKSEIIQINQMKKDGFIKNYDRVKYGAKDFYFLFSNLTFEPYLGARVNFIPGINNARKYQSLPFAYFVKKQVDNLPTAFIRSIKSKGDKFILLLEGEINKMMFIAFVNREILRLANISEEVIGAKCAYEIINQSSGESSRYPVVKIYPYEKE